jgi:hypothetical protein
MAINRDFKDLFAALSAEAADFIVVGAHAVMVHTEPRYTKDLDVWVRPSIENARKVIAALRAFGAPMTDLAESDLEVEGTIFQMGVAPNRIDILTSIDGVAFDEAWIARVATVYGDVPIAVLSIEHLLRNKRTVNRLQDQIDVEKLERARTKH